MDHIGVGTFFELADGIPRSTNREYFVGELLSLRQQRRTVTALTRSISMLREDPQVIRNGFCRELRDTLEIIEEDTQQHLGRTTPLVVSAREAAAQPIDPPGAVIADLILEQSLTLVHGHPRTGKSVVARECSLAIPTGTAPFGLKRLAVSKAGPVLYVSEEDSLQRTVRSLELLARGRGCDGIPPGVDLVVRRGLSLDDRAWQQRLIDAVRAGQYVTVILDPLRSLTSAVDQGPAELRPFAEFLRRFQGETGTALLLVHHDTKPPIGAKDTRRLPHRASGGGIYSIADAPIHVEEGGPSESLLTPTAWKFSDDPVPILVRRERGDDWLRLTAEDAPGTTGADAALSYRIKEFLTHSPGVTGSAIASGVGARKAAVLAALKQLAASGTVDSVEEKRSTRWFIARSQAGAEHVAG